MHRTVLYIAYVFPPMAGSAVQRTLKFVKYLPEFGWNPKVLTIRPYSQHVQDEALLSEVPPSVEVLRCHSLEVRRLPQPAYRLAHTWPALKLRGLLEVPDHCIGWLPFALKAARDLIARTEVDLVFSSFPPATANLIGCWLRKTYGLPWVAEFRDPWTHHPSFQRLAPTALHSRLYRRLERMALFSADRTVVVSDPMKRDFLKDNPGLSPDRIAVITNGYDEEDFAAAGNGYNRNGRGSFTVAYAGHLGGHLASSALRPLWTALKTLMDGSPSDTRGWRVKFMGAFGEDVLASARAAGLGDMVQYLGYLSHEESIRQLHRADVLLAHSFSYQYLHAKTFEYLRAGRPILALARRGDALAGLIEQSGAGVVAPPDDEPMIAGALWQLFQAKAAGKAAWGASRVFIAQYERKALTSKLAALFNEVVAERGRG